MSHVVVSSTIDLNYPQSTLRLVQMFLHLNDLAVRVLKNTSLVKVYLCRKMMAVDKRAKEAVYSALLSLFLNLPITANVFCINKL